MSIEDLLDNGYWSEREGREAVELWRASGESVSEFCARTGLRRRRLTYWAQRLESTSTSGALALAPVTVLSAPRVGALAIELRSGRTIHLEGAVDDELLARVITVAERAGC